MSTGIFYLVYTSIATSRMSDGELFSLLAQSRHNNEMHKLTGMLLYMEGRFITKAQGRFIQFLEGEKQEVLRVYQNICTDQRNVSTLMLCSGFWHRRSFPTWLMGFRVLDAAQYDNFAGFFNLGNVLEMRGMEEGNHTTAYLQSFFLVNSKTD